MSFAVGMMIGVLVGVVLAFLAFALFIVWFCRRERKKVEHMMMKVARAEGPDGSTLQ